MGFELDCFWCVRAGKDPVDYFQRFPGRFPQLHIKDLNPATRPPPGKTLGLGPSRKSARASSTGRGFSRPDSKAA